MNIEMKVDLFLIIVCMLILSAFKLYEFIKAIGDPTSTRF